MFYHTLLITGMFRSLLRSSSLSNDPPCDTHFYYQPKIPLSTAQLCYWPNHPGSKS